MSAAGALAAADVGTFSRALGKAVADEAVFWRAGCFTYARPLFGDGGAVSTIQCAEHTDAVQGASRAFLEAHAQDDLARLWGRDDALLAVGSESASRLDASTRALRERERRLVPGSADSKMIPPQ